MDVLVVYGVMKEDALKPEQFFLPLKALSLSFQNDYWGHLSSPISIEEETLTGIQPSLEQKLVQACITLK